MNKGHSSKYSRSRVYYHTQKHSSTGNIPKAGYTHYIAVNVHTARCTYYKLLAPVRVRQEHRSFPPRPSTMQKLWLWYVCEKNTGTVLFHPALPRFKHYLYIIIEHLLTSTRNIHPCEILAALCSLCRWDPRIRSPLGPAYPAAAGTN
jgi:hypothetical protein